MEKIYQYTAGFGNMRVSSVRAVLSRNIHDIPAVSRESDTSLYQTRENVSHTERK